MLCLLPDGAYESTSQFDNTSLIEFTVAPGSLSRQVVRYRLSNFLPAVPQRL